jgi:hypothetical protein
VSTLRVFGTSALLIALYYVIPLDRIDVSIWIPLTAGLVILVVVAVAQIRSILNSPHPSIRALEALAATIPWFIVLFASSYFLIEQANPASFNAESLSRSDSLYFTITVLTTVGFGDIAATTESARLVVSAQMILDLVLLGLGIRVIGRAVQVGKERHQITGPLEEPDPSL